MENQTEERLQKLIDEGITPIGKTAYRGKDKLFGIKTDDRRRHMYVIGKTGVGKSTLLENMAIADIEAGRGMGIVDPHGELAETLLDFIPEDRLEDVIYFDPSDTEYPIGLNPLEQVSGEHRHLIASSIMGVFKKIWPDVWSSRMEYILNNTLLALLEYPNTTLVEVLRMFSDKSFREQVVEGLEDPVVKDFWVKEFAEYPERYQREAVGAIQNKVGQFVTNPLIRNILGQSRSSINFKEVMDEGKILIVNLSKGKIGEDNMSLLGGMVITKVQLAAMARAKDPSRNYRDFFLSVDEFQNFATDSFASILSEARKYRLSLTLAHQYINQLIFEGKTKVKDAVMGNIGTMVSFRIGAEDAEELEPEYLPDYEANDLVNLPKYHILTKLMIDGLASQPFPAQTIPPRERPEGESPRETIIEYSRKKYATPRSYVEKRMKERRDTNNLLRDKSEAGSEVSLKDMVGGEVTKEESSPDVPSDAPSDVKAMEDKKAMEGREEVREGSEESQVEGSEQEQDEGESKEVKRKKPDVDINELKGMISDALSKAGRDNSGGESSSSEKEEED